MSKPYSPKNLQVHFDGGREVERWAENKRINC